MQSTRSNEFATCDVVLSNFCERCGAVARLLLGLARKIPCFLTWFLPAHQPLHNQQGEPQIGSVMLLLSAQPADAAWPAEWPLAQLSLLLRMPATMPLARGRGAV